MKSLKKILLISATLVSAIVTSFSAPLHNKMSVPAYGTARSVKVCTIYKKLGMACGTGVYVGKNKVLTETHIIGHIKTQDMDIGPNGFTVTTYEDDPMQVMVLNQNGQSFKPAVIVSSHTNKDLAILTTDEEVNSEVILSYEFERGQEVWVVGNPGSEDFKPVKTKIVGVYLFNDNGEVRSLITVDSQNNQIRPGFSGGGIFNLNGGLIGLLEVCNPSDKICAGIAASDINKYLKEAK